MTFGILSEPTRRLSAIFECETNMDEAVFRLKRQIEAAFADVPNPGGKRKPVTSLFDDEGVDEYFRGTPWQGHPVRTLRSYSSALSFFLPWAYHYYLPAFMLAELEDPETADIIADSIVFDFSPSKSSSLLATRIELFSKPQLAAVKAFIEYLIVEYGEYGSMREAREYLDSLL